MKFSLFNLLEKKRIRKHRKYNLYSLHARAGEMICQYNQSAGGVNGEKEKSWILENIFKSLGMSFQHPGLRPVRRKKDILLYCEIIP